jgi:tRNA G18 (ribose-2'-O)-methylase SpoU
VVAVEQDATSKPYTEIEYKPPVCIIVGNETYGVLPETLALADSIAEIPMWGINKSLNVIVSAAIASYYIIGKLKK